jgi:TonB family protein
MRVLCGSVALLSGLTSLPGNWVREWAGRRSRVKRNEALSAAFASCSNLSGRAEMLGCFVNKVNLDALPRASHTHSLAGAMRAGSVRALIFLLLLAGGQPRMAHAADARRMVAKKCVPVYPTLARSMHVYGKITLTVAVQPDGRVGGITAASGHPLLVQAAEAAVRQWVFVPEATATTETVVVDFPFSLI